MIAAILLSDKAREDRASANPPARAEYIKRARSELHHRELRLAHVAQRAAPVVRNGGEARTRRDAFFGQAFFLVVDPAANQADPALKFSQFNYFAHDVLFSVQCNDPPVCPFLGRGGDLQYYRNL